MTGARRRPLVTRPVRRVRRWARHTQNGEIALTLITLGVALVFVAAMCAIFLL